MSTNFSFSIAGQSDDNELLFIMREIAMPGPISLTFCCEPSFLFAKNIGCIKSETMICRRNDTGKIVGFGSRSLWNIYQNGEKKTIWYLHSLRSLDEERNSMLLLRAYRYLHSLPNDSDFPCYLTTILDDNDYAKKVLESGRAGLPIYSKIGTMITHLIPLRVKKKIRADGINVEKCNPEVLSSAFLCLDDWNGKHDLSLALDLNEMRGPNSLFQDFSFQSLYVSLSGKLINGTLGVWDQKFFKQTVVKSYHQSMKIARYFYNIYSYVKGLPFLPKEGEKINMIFASFLSVKNDDQFVFESLLEKAICDWSGCGYDWLAVGLCKNSPLEKTLIKYSKREIISSVYFVHWKDDNVVLPKIEFLNLEISIL
jgi:hypothetical protein